ncbi:tRNA1(Val) (adenine(37)-N6)-methyltransferase [Ferruginibacter sp. SUN106]|uniref:tRNA1(Val) (adenine(37)-N6)-methyltransferase n=1 Tax=Ferruginibacter sp. SUN106 TaxID=2978348 RepID=UPI003D35EB0E
MANNYFQFKQFTIHQDQCAMKVCTDACLFGAYIADELQTGVRSAVKNILDIGTGTGLLSLMLAQKTNVEIDTVEIDTAAYLQAKENIEQSLWKEKVTIYNNNIRQFESHKKYDCIISNPPFFENDLISDDKKKNAAKHDSTLTLQELLTHTERLLSAEGFFALLLPYHRTNYFEEEAEKLNFSLAKKILVKQTTKHKYFRSILIFSRNKITTQTKAITIKNESGNYSEEFILLLKDYYLYL